jgi:hypothetical protein
MHFPVELQLFVCLFSSYFNSCTISYFHYSWSFFTVKTSYDYSMLQVNSSVQAYAAGLAEGKVSYCDRAVHFQECE